MAQDLPDAAAEYHAAKAAVDDAKAQVIAAQGRLRAARDGLHESILADARGRYRTRMSDMAEMTGLSREWIRQILRAAGIDPY